jgi:hypothetical protein
MGFEWSWRAGRPENGDDVAQKPLHPAITARLIRITGGNLCLRNRLLTQG